MRNASREAAHGPRVSLVVDSSSEAGGWGNCCRHCMYCLLSRSHDLHALYIIMWMKEDDISVWHKAPL